MFLRHFVPWSSADQRAKVYGDRPRRTAPSVVERKSGQVTFEFTHLVMSFFM